MNTRDTGGPAFPVDWETFNRSNGNPAGLTTRDYFAAKAMAAMIGGTWPDNADRAELAKRSYLMADAMLLERTK